LVSKNFGNFNIKDTLHSGRPIEKCW